MRRLLPPLRTVLLALLVLYLAHRIGHPEALAGWGGYSGPRKSSGGGHVRTRTVRRVAAHPSRHSGHVVTGRVHRVAAHPSVRHRVARHGVRGSSHHATRSSRLPSIHSHVSGLSSKRQRQNLFIKRLVAASAKLGLSRKATRALVLALHTHGSGLRWIYERQGGPNAIVAGSKEAAHANKVILHTIERIRKLESKHATPVGLALAARGGYPGDYKLMAPVAKAEVKNVSKALAKGLPVHYSRGVGSLPKGSQAAVIAKAAKKYGISPKILWGLYGTETNFGRNKNTSSAGAVGPFQFLPSTARGMGVNPYNFKSAAYGAAKYLAQYKNRGTAGMLSAYNAGPAGAQQPGYVAQVLHHAHSFPKGGVGKKVQTSRKGTPYHQIRMHYGRKFGAIQPKPKPIPAPSGSGGSSGSTGSSSRVGRAVTRSAAPRSSGGGSRGGSVVESAPSSFSTGAAISDPTTTAAARDQLLQQFALSLAKGSKVPNVTDPLKSLKSSDRTLQALINLGFQLKGL